MQREALCQYSNWNTLSMFLLHSGIMMRTWLIWDILGIVCCYWVWFLANRLCSTLERIPRCKKMQRNKLCSFPIRSPLFSVLLACRHKKGAPQEDRVGGVFVSHTAVSWASKTVLNAQEPWLNPTQFPMSGMRRKSCGPGDRPPTAGKRHLRGEEQLLREKV